MAGQLLVSMGIKLNHDYKKGVFQSFSSGWILPLFDLKSDTIVVKSQIFLSSMITCQTLVDEKSEVCGYYLYSNLKTRVSDYSILAYNRLHAKQSKRVFNDGNLVIIEYPKCGTLALSNMINPIMQTILEEQ